MEGHCSSGKSPQWAVVPMGEEEEKEDFLPILISMNTLPLCRTFLRTAA